MGWFESKILADACKNNLLQMLWHKIVPCNIRGRFFYWLLLRAKVSEKCCEMTINMLEEPCAYDFNKKEQVLKFLKKNKFGVFSPKFCEIWLEKDSASNRIFNFNGAFLPYTKELGVETLSLSLVVVDTFLVSLLFNDDYSAYIVGRLDEVIKGEGPYGYTADGFDVTVKRGDTVIDAGAWIGDFSAYAASKGAVSYAFEPTAKTFKALQKTAELNRGGGGRFTL
jgi:hypothetical protein